ncbi:hypothetical protein VITFI_CDS2490 [Vitreoscilla filiformis]|uniref:Uncharacterized protein n=1 Tax=Vitreoscilla filiformis TaxID=63 RepID=A0A221KGV7_VITFI|nr:hypothetical protein VITFI_CDS2490 [Vitreoscilla filiformis]
MQAVHLAEGLARGLAAVTTALALATDFFWAACAAIGAVKQRTRLMRLQRMEKTWRDVVFMQKSGEKPTDLSNVGV